jgi:3-hydroxyacyl-[acyl-carrier-protein] dehydratase
VLLCEAVFQTGALFLARSLGEKGAPSGVPLLVKISNVRFRNPVYPGDTVTIEVTKKDLMAGFYAMSGSMKKGETRVLSVDYSVAWKTPGGSP